MNKIIILLFLINSACRAQPEGIRQIAQQVSIENLKKNLYYLASDKLEGRLMGSHGDTIASLYIADWFRKNNLIAPYDEGRSYFQAITAQKKVAVKEMLTIDGKEYSRWDGWVMDDKQNIRICNMPIVFTGYGLEDSLYNDFKHIEVEGKAVIIFFGQPKRNNKDTIVGITKHIKLSDKLETLKQRGAVVALLYDNYFSEDKELNKKYEYRPQYINRSSMSTPKLPFIYVSEQRLNELLSQDQTAIQLLKDSINKSLQSASFQLTQQLNLDVKINLQQIHAPNVIGIIYGTDTSSGNIIVSAHHDHLGKAGNDIYHGASDDAAGTAALMELAALMNNASHKGMHPKRTIMFLSTTGEEGGDLGSFFFIDHPLFRIQKTIADMNLDVLGRIDDAHMHMADSSEYVYALLKDNENKVITNALEKANGSSTAVHISYIYKETNTATILNFMDTHPFIERHIPCINFFTGATKDAVQPTDTADKIDYELLAKQTQLAFLTLWNLANE